MAEFVRWLFRAPQSTDGAIANGIAWGVIATIALIAAVFIGGQTFGQRCAEEYENGSRQWSSCVERLSKGGSIHG